MHGQLTGNNAPHNLLFSNGVACTTTSFIAASIGYSSLEQLSVDQLEQIRRIHLLLCMYNAFQPGVFALSGWDLVGALPLCKDSVDCLMADGDTRWINRGSYDLMDVAPNAKLSNGGLPRARALYGSLRAQLSQPESFASQLRKILDARKRMQVFAARQIDILDVSHPALLVMVHKLPNDNVTQFTALNFGQEPLEECLRIDGVNDGQFIDVVGDRSPIHVDSYLRTIKLKLDSYEGGAFVHRK
jgi:trehalose synthase